VAAKPSQEIDGLAKVLRRLLELQRGLAGRETMESLCLGLGVSRGTHCRKSLLEVEKRILVPSRPHQDDSENTSRACLGKLLALASRQF
jgi:hypothetical protein